MTRVAIWERKSPITKRISFYLRWADPTTGQPTYAKRTMIVPVDPNINAHPHVAHLDWYRAEKGFKHPFDKPDRPDDLDIRSMDRRRLDTVEAVYARMGELAAEGLDVEKLTGPKTAAEE